MIYSFDKNMQNVALTTLIKNYNVQQAPTIVIDNQVYPGFQGRSILEPIIEPNQTQATINNK